MSKGPNRWIRRKVAKTFQLFFMGAIPSTFRHPYQDCCTEPRPCKILSTFSSKPGSNFTRINWHLWPSFFIRVGKQWRITVICSSGLTVFKHNTYGVFAQRGMDYGLWYPFFREPTWWTEKGMGYKGVWVIRAMG